MVSLAFQTRPPDEVLLIDDMHGLPNVFRYDGGEDRETGYRSSYPVRTWFSPWRLGVAHAFNMGIALAENELVFMLGADDRLLPNCLHEVWRVYEKLHRQDAYYWVGVEYSDDREEKHQFAPCGAAAVTKGLWRFTGGFPVEASTGASDSALVSILWKHHLELLVGVGVEREPLYWYRVHDQSDTASKGPWQGVILGTRDLVTAEWKEPAWGRYQL